MSITLLATPLVVIALVNLAKRLGLSGAGPLALLAVILGVGHHRRRLHRDRHRPDPRPHRRRPLRRRRQDRRHHLRRRSRHRRVPRLGRGRDRDLRRPRQPPAGPLTMPRRVAVLVLAAWLAIAICLLTII